MLPETLHAKYVELRALRSETVGAEARPRLRALAERFPGALRELDALPNEEIDARIEALDHVVSGRASEEPWMAAMHRFHVLTRAALRAKRWLGTRKSVDEATRQAFVRAHANDEAMEWAEELQELATPMRGRITHVVMSRVAREHRVSVEDALRLVRLRGY